MAEGMAKCGSYLAKDERACYFHKHIGEKAVREAADTAIERFGRNSATEAADLPAASEAFVELPMVPKAPAEIIPVKEQS